MLYLTPHGTAYTTTGGEADKPDALSARGGWRRRHHPHHPASTCVVILLRVGSRRPPARDATGQGKEWSILLRRPLRAVDAQSASRLKALTLTLVPYLLFFFHLCFVSPIILIFFLIFFPLSPFFSSSSFFFLPPPFAPAPPSFVLIPFLLLLSRLLFLGIQLGLRLCAWHFRCHVEKRALLFFFIAGGNSLATVTEDTSPPPLGPAAKTSEIFKC